MRKLVTENFADKAIEKTVDVIFVVIPGIFVTTCSSSSIHFSSQIDIGSRAVCRADVLRAFCFRSILL